MTKRTWDAELTPELAQELRANERDHSALTEGVIRRYMGAITRGEWTYGSVIHLDEQGRLHSGRKRCEAVIRTGIAIPITFISGLTDDELRNVDQGQTWSARRLLAMEGYAYAGDLAAAIKFEHNFVNGIHTSTKVTPAQQLAHLERNPTLPEAVPYRSRYNRAFGGSAVLFVVFMHQARRVKRYKDFAEQLITGEGLEVGNPALTLRRKLAAMEKQGGIRDATVRAKEVMSMYVISLNAYAKHRRIRGISIPDSVPELEDSNGTYSWADEVDW